MTSTGVLMSLLSFLTSLSDQRKHADPSWSFQQGMNKCTDEDHQSRETAKLWTWRDQPEPNEKTARHHRKPKKPHQEPLNRTCATRTINVMQPTLITKQESLQPPCDHTLGPLKTYQLSPAPKEQKQRGNDRKEESLTLFLNPSALVMRIQITIGESLAIQQSASLACKTKTHILFWLYV